MLSVAFFALFAVCCDAEYRYAEYPYAECHALQQQPLYKGLCECLHGLRGYLVKKLNGAMTLIIVTHSVTTKLQTLR